MQIKGFVEGDIVLSTGHWHNEKHKVGSIEHFDLWKQEMEEYEIAPSQFAYGVFYNLCPICCGDCKFVEEQDKHIITTVCKYCKGMGSFKAYYAEQPLDTVRKLQLEFTCALQTVRNVATKAQKVPV